MHRFLPYLFLLSVFTPTGGIAQTDSSETLDRLEHLEDAMLPGEIDEQKLTDTNPDPQALLGKKIINITAVDPPAGFDPVSDANIPLGMSLDAALVRKATKRLWESGLYSDVQIYARPLQGDTVELLIEVTPMLRVKSLEISGNKVLDDDDVARSIEYTIDRTIRADPEVLRKLKVKLLGAYSAKGHKEAQAALRIETTSKPGGVVLVIKIEEGIPERYATIRLENLPEDLDEALILRRVSLKDGMPRNRKNVEDSLPSIKKQLFENGYLDADIGQLEEQRLGRYNVSLVIPIIAKVKTKIDFRNNKYFRNSTLKEKLFTDDTFRTSPSSVENGIRRLTEFCRSKGFFHARITGKRVCTEGVLSPKLLPFTTTCSPQTTLQQLVFKIHEGPDVEVTKIVVGGNDHFTRSELEAEIFAFVAERLEKGDAFQPFSTETLDDLGLSDKRDEGLGKHEGLKTYRRNQSRTYVPDLYAEATVHLEEMYQEQGYLGVHATDVCKIKNTGTLKLGNTTYVPFLVSRQEEDEEDSSTQRGPCVFVNADRDQLIVKINVKEGPQTEISKISFFGNTSFEPDSIQKASTLSVSTPYNEYEIGDSLRKYEDFYKNNGYMFVKIDWDKSFSTDMKEADITFTIKEGPQVRVGRIRIEGAETTSEKLIRERLVLEKGSLITPERLEESQQRLMDLGIFDSGLVQMVSPENPSSVKNIVVQVKEGDFQYMEFRAGMASIEGLRGGFEYGYRNIAGWAITARLRARANYRLFFPGAKDNEVIKQFEQEFRNLDNELMEQIEHHIMFSLTQSHFPGTHGILGWGIDGTIERKNEPAFGASRNTAFFRLNAVHDLGTKFSRALQIESRTGIEDTDLNVWAAPEDGSTQINPTLQNFMKMPEGETVFSVTGLKISLDFRDAPLNPTRGMRLMLNADYVTSVAQSNTIYQWTELGQRLGEPGSEVNTSEYSSTELHDYIDEDKILPVERQSNLIRAQATLSGYIPFSDDGAVLALSVSGGYIFHLANSQTWADRYFYAGGVDTLRGFPEDSLIPEDTYQQLKYTRSQDTRKSILQSPGGQVMFVARAEVRYPISRGFLGALFAEAGNVWRDQKHVNIFDPDTFELHLRPVAGGGIRYVTGLGLFSLDLGINLDKRAHEERFAPFLSIGSAF